MGRLVLRPDDYFPEILGFLDPLVSSTVSFSVRTMIPYSLSAGMTLRVIPGIPDSRF